MNFNKLYLSNFVIIIAIFLYQSVLLYTHFFLYFLSNNSILSKVILSDNSYSPSGLLDTSIQILTSSISISLKYIFSLF